jgi:hypothetical protein
MRENKRRKENNLGKLISLLVVFVLLIIIMPYIAPAKAEVIWDIKPVEEDNNVYSGVSMALDNWNGIHISYYDVNNGNLRHAYKPYGAQEFESSLVHSGILPIPAPLNLFTSIAIDGLNNIHISYHDENTDKLMYIKKPLLGSEWDTPHAFNEAGDAGQYSSIAIDKSNNPHIAYYQREDSKGVLKYVKKTDSGWMTPEIVPVPSGESSNYYGLYVSLVLISEGDEEYPHMSYYYNDAVTGYKFLRYAYKMDTIWHIQTVPDISSSTDYGRCLSMTVDKDSKIHISYIDVINSELKYACSYERAPPATWWREIPDSNALSAGADIESMSTSIAVDESNKPHICYLSSGRKQVRYASIGASGALESKDVEALPTTGQNDNLFSSIALDNLNRPHLAFYNSDSNEGLKYANGRIDYITYKVVVDNKNTLHFKFIISSGTGRSFVNPERFDKYHIMGDTPPTLLNGDIVIEGYLIDDTDDGWIEVHAYLNGELIKYKIFVMRYGTQPGIVLLIDVSGSMSWTHNGDWINVPPNRQRISYARRAAKPYIDLLHDYFIGHTSVGIATFPIHPYVYNPNGCGGDDNKPLKIIKSDDEFESYRIEIGGLFGRGDTPLLDGMEKAKNMLTSAQDIGPNKAIILLSDGYHNCPSSITSPESQDRINNLILELKQNSINVFTIGFGRPTDIDHPLLEKFALETGGVFYDVTGPYFDPENWDPQTALQAVYKSILANWYDLQPVVDPFDSIDPDETVTHYVKLNEYDQKVSFFVSWSTSERGKLEMTIFSSDDKPVPITRPEINFHDSETYQILTVGERFLRLPGKVGPTPWKINISASNLTSGPELKYQYSVISDSNLKMEADVQAPEFAIGSNLTLNVKITQAGIPIRGLTNISVDIARPEKGIGNWFAEHDVSLKDLEKIPDKIGNETLSSRYRKTTYLIEERNVSFPGHINVGTLQLFDDGTHGDDIANDGNYKNLFADTVTEGTYSFHVYVNGSTMGGNYFERETEIQKYIRPKFSSKDSHGEVVNVEKDDRIQRIRVTFTPMDALDNHLGPGYAGLISMNVTWGKEVSELIDNIDGTYSQEFEVPIDVAAEAEITVQFGGVPKSVSWEDPPKSDDCESLQQTIYFLMSLLIIMIILILVLLVKLRRKSK